MHNLIQLPFDLPGQIYRSPMPFGLFDEGGTTIDEYDQAGINLVVMLIDEEEDLFRTGKKLDRIYRSHGMEVLRYPIEDFDTPDDIKGLSAALETVEAAARAGKNIAVHCYAGRGRTGMFLALLGRRVLGLGGEEAITWVRRFFPAIETVDQEDLVRGEPFA